MNWTATAAVLQAAATIVLVLLTAIYVRKTSKLAEQASRQADSAAAVAGIATKPYLEVVNPTDDPKRPLLLANLSAASILVTSFHASIGKDHLYADDIKSEDGELLGTLIEPGKVKKFFLNDGQREELERKEGRDGALSGSAGGIQPPPAEPARRTYIHSRVYLTVGYCFGPAGPQEKPLEFKRNLLWHHNG